MNKAQELGQIAATYQGANLNGPIEHAIAQMTIRAGDGWTEAPINEIMFGYYKAWSESDLEEQLRAQGMGWSETAQGKGPGPVWVNDEAMVTQGVRWLCPNHEEYHHPHYRTTCYVCREERSNG